MQNLQRVSAPVPNLRFEPSPFTIPNNVVDIDVKLQDVSGAGIHGTLVQGRRYNNGHGVVLSHAIAGNRYCLIPLAKTLARRGFTCLSVDLPAHYLNVRRFTLGEIAATVNQAALVLKGYGCRAVSAVGHSIGGVATILANAGYNRDVENRIFKLWYDVLSLLTFEAKGAKKGKLDASSLVRLREEADRAYTGIKQLLLAALKEKVRQGAHFRSMVLLAPPRDIKGSIPGIKYLPALSHKWRKWVFETIVHTGAIKQNKEEGNPLQLSDENRASSIHFQALEITDSTDFLDYFLNMKEPSDYLQLIEALCNFRHKDKKVSFVEYYQKKYLFGPPKLFLYGRMDELLRPFFGSNRKRLEQFYRSCGNAVVKSGWYSHQMMPKRFQPNAAQGVQRPEVLDAITRFIETQRSTF